VSILVPARRLHRQCLLGSLGSRGMSVIALDSLLEAIRAPSAGLRLLPGRSADRPALEAVFTKHRLTP